MLEMVDIALFIGSVLVIFVGSGVGGFLIRLLIDGASYSKLERRILSLEQAEKGVKSGEVRQLKAERKQEAITKAAMLIKNGENPKEVLMKVGTEYPDVAMDLLGKQGLF